ncbi:inorganic phosphate transporter [Snodgrassella sp. CFCC 13594]|uniref:inorganic phosphate transporter n=1 Tax=Snodgrassella sp. CFCC 13594 TaxID=1775559 RepID=UPI00082A9EFD|nr:inorganic phosphate transporter [Snodgrassella sp. CFCC 13594]
MATASSSPSALTRVNYAFAALLVGTVAYFIAWGWGYTNHNMPMVFVVATLFGVFMAFNIGGNDVANSFGTSVGAGTLSIPQALAIAAVFEVSGAVIAGGEVTKTIRHGIIDLGAMQLTPGQLINIMLSALLAAALWLLFASKKGLPVSTTHSIIGGIVGSALCLGWMVSGDSTALHLIQWHKMGEIALSWVLSPLLGGAMSFLLFSQIKKHVLDYNVSIEAQLKTLKQQKKAYKEQHREQFERLTESQKIEVASAMARDAQIYSESDFNEDELESDYYRGLVALEKRKGEIDTYKALHHWVPLISAAGSIMIAAMLLFKGLTNLHLGLSALNNFLIIGMIGALVWMATFIYAKTLKRKDLSKSTFLMFSWMQVFTAAGFAFSHGANDISNAVGPFAAIMDVIRTNSIGTDAQAQIPTPVMITFGVALIVGLWFIGKEVIQTVGTNLAKMHPASGFTAELSAASIVMLATLMGLPVSSTHILVGSVLGIGLVNRNANWALMKPIALAWVVTLPSVAILSVVVFLGLNSIF